MIFEVKEIMSSSDTEIEASNCNSQDIHLFINESPIPKRTNKRHREEYPDSDDDRSSEQSVSLLGDVGDSNTDSHLPCLRRSPRKHSASQKLIRFSRSGTSRQLTSTPTVSSTPSQHTSTARTATKHVQFSIRSHLEEILANQREIISNMKLFKKELGAVKELVEKKVEEEKPPVTVPNKIRNAVKDAHQNGTERELCWNLQKRFGDHSNKEMTEYIEESVKGIHPDISSEVLLVAMKRYFTSKREAANRVAKNKDTLHKTRQATYERKKEKARRRLHAIGQKSKWSTEKKERCTRLFNDKKVVNYMSSDEEGDDGFISHPYSWESEEFQKIKEALDRKFLDICAPRSRRMLMRRTRGSVKNSEAPDISQANAWIMK